MLYQLKQVLAPEELRELREIANRTQWADGRKSAGAVAALHKRNTEAEWDSPEGKLAAKITVKALRRHPQFFDAALPASMSPPMMNRYVAGMEYGDHCDAAIMGLQFVDVPGQDAAEGEDVGVDVGHRISALHRRSPRLAGDRHPSGESLRDQIEAALIGERTLASIAGHGSVDQAEILARENVVAQPELLIQSSWTSRA